MKKLNNNMIRRCFFAWLAAVAMTLCSLTADAPAAVTNVASGNLTHDQTVFTTNGTGGLRFDLVYESLSPYTGSMGTGWIHSADIFLTVDASNNVLLRSGISRIYYRKNGATYISQPGDTSALTGTTGAFTITHRDGTRFVFDANNRISAITDRFGNAQSFGYSGGDLTSISDPAGRVAILEYDTGVTPHRLAKIAPPGVAAGDPDSRKYQFIYTTDGRLRQLINPAADQAPGTERGYWEYTYENGRLKTVRDPAGFTSRYNYYSDGRVQSATDPEGVASGIDAGHTRSLAYNGEAGTIKTTTLTEKDGGRWLYSYDTQAGQLKSKKGPDETGNPGTRGKSYYYYPTTGYLKARTEPFGTNETRTTFFMYDGNGNLTGETEPLVYTGNADTEDTATFGTSGRPSWAFTYAYTTVGLNGVNFDAISTITDQRNGEVTSYQYDTSSGQLVTSIIDPRNQGTIIRYNPNGIVREIVDANNTTVSGTVVTEKSGAQKALFEYYPSDTQNSDLGRAGLLWKVTVPSVATNPDATTVVSSITSTITGYDLNGNVTGIAVTDAGGATVPVNTILVHDALSRLTSLTRSSTTGTFASQITGYGYNLAGSLTSFTDAESRTTIYTPDFRGQVTAITDSLQKTTSISYAEFGCPDCGGGPKVTGVKDARAAENSNPGTIYSFDNWSRMTMETDPLAKKIRYEYYDNGLVWKTYDNSATPEKLLVTYTYNDRKQVTDKTYPDGSGDHYTYNPDGTLASASNQNTTYSFAWHTTGSNKGRLKSITDSAGRQISYDDYDSLGQRKQVTVLKGSGSDERVITYLYDEANRPKGITSASGAFSYGYDRLGRRSSLRYPNSITAGYGYDDLNRLSGIRHAYSGSTITFVDYTVFDKLGNRRNKVTAAGTENYQYDELYRLTQAAAPNGTENFSYDAVGNRKTGPGPKDIRYQYDAANRMTRGKLFDYDYDNLGNQTKRTLPGVPEADKGWVITWDNENHLATMERVKKKDGVVLEKRTVSFTYDPFGRRIGKQLVTLKSGISKTTSWSYVYDGDDIAVEIYTPPSGPQEKTFYTHGPGIDEHLAMERNSSHYFYHADGLNSITTITDTGRNIVQSYTYDSFGMVKPSTNFRNSYTYTGREWDKETGLHYYRARYYDPMDGRFIQKDPISFVGGDVNLYGMTSNNPINKVDPTGLYGEDVHYYLTFMLAIQAGFSLNDAAIISQANQGVDEGLFTMPYAYPFGTMLHFMSRSETIDRLDKACTSKSLINFGKALHSFQDTYSHAGYNWIKGHAKDKKLPDIFRPEHSRDKQMSIDSLNYMVKLKNSL